jgi:hypothetical protein
VTATEPEPPLSATSCEAGAIVNVHGGGGGGGAAAACDTVKVCPPMVRVPVRAAAGFAATLNATVPLPVPDAPLVTVNHAAFALAVHAHVFADAVTVTVPVVPPSAASCDAGEILKVHGGGGAAACVTVKVFPAAAIVAVRELLVVLAATVNLTLPLPVPERPAVMLIQDALVVAVQAQVLADEVTAIDPDPPAAATLCVEGEIEKLQAGGGAAA